MYEKYSVLVLTLVIQSKFLRHFKVDKYFYTVILFALNSLIIM